MRCLGGRFHARPVVNTAENRSGLPKTLKATLVCVGVVFDARLDHPVCNRRISCACWGGHDAYARTLP